MHQLAKRVILRLKALTIPAAYVRNAPVYVIVPSLCSKFSKKKFTLNQLLSFCLCPARLKL
jgi:hypothetical protein